MSKKQFLGKIEAAKELGCNVQTAQRLCRELYKKSDGHIVLLACGYVMDKIGLELLKKNLGKVGISKTRAKV